VDVQLASNRLLEKIAELWPDGMNCCSMTEKQRQLSVESNANFGETVLHTTLNLEQLVVETENIEISHDCGKFAC
jgi:pyroglutamyl-peptidase